MGFSGGTVVKNLPANAWDAGLIPASGRSPGEGNGTPLCMGNPMNRGALAYSLWGLKRIGHDWSNLAHRKRNE